MLLVMTDDFPDFGTDTIRFLRRNSTIGHGIASCGVMA